jgi:hypothetical protein
VREIPGVRGWRAALTGRCRLHALQAASQINIREDQARHRPRGVAYDGGRIGRLGLSLSHDGALKVLGSIELEEAEGSVVRQTGSAQDRYPIKLG